MSNVLTRVYATLVWESMIKVGILYNSKNHIRAYLAKECAGEHYVICQNREDSLPRCKNGGNCYPCSLDEEKGLELCNAKESQQGFQCSCPPGMKQPYCETREKPCDMHLCEN